MSLNLTPSSERVHIGFFGARNAGKSSVVNAVTDQEISVVSEKKGTTTDPVYKSMELLPLGPVVIIDTPGFDDDEEILGEKRIKKAKQVLNKSDIAVLVIDSAEEDENKESEILISLFKEKNIPYIIAYNKSDLKKRENLESNELLVSAKTGEGIFELKESLARLVKRDGAEKKIVGDLISEKATVVLVTPIDESAPKGRLILPQQQTIRDILDAGATALVTKETELLSALSRLKDAPDLVICDSQVFSEVSEIVPENVPLTSFSILMARYKGYLAGAVSGVSAIENLKDGDTVLIAEGCTHHRQCNDIGTVKIPNWLFKYTNKKINIKTVSGTEFPEDLSEFSLIIHCGGCMLGDREVTYRTKCARDAGVPMTNYGVVIAYMKGILPRSLEILPEIKKLLN